MASARLSCVLCASKGESLRGYPVSGNLLGVDFHDAAVVFGIHVLFILTQRFQHIHRENTFQSRGVFVRVKSAILCGSILPPKLKKGKTAIPGKDAIFFCPKGGRREVDRASLFPIKGAVEKG